MEDNIVMECDLYTYDAAVSRYERERHHEWLCMQKKLEKIRYEEQERRRYFCNQKFIGLIIVVLDLLLTLIIGNMACIVLAIPGIGLIFTKKMAIVNEYFWSHGGTDQWK